jgi:hypothetical protein
MQSIVGSTLHQQRYHLLGQENPNPYIDSTLHGKSDTFDDHLTILNKIFQQLKDSGSELCAKMVEFLGFLLM